MACERQGMTLDQLKAGISSLYSAARDLPIVVFKANNVAVAKRSTEALLNRFNKVMAKIKNWREMVRHADLI